MIGYIIGIILILFLMLVIYCCLSINKLVSKRK